MRGSVHPSVRPSIGPSVPRSRFRNPPTSIGWAALFFYLNIRFEQRAWLASFIAYNNEQRKKATNLCERDFWKLINNSVSKKSLKSFIIRVASLSRTLYSFFIFSQVFGKFGENKRLHDNVTLVRSANLFRRRVAKVNYHSSVILSKNTILVRMLKTNVKLDRPIYLTGVILDRSKLKVSNVWTNKASRQASDASSRPYMMVHP